MFCYFTSSALSENLNFYLIKPSIQCQAQLNIGFKKFFKINNNSFSIVLNSNDSLIKSTINKGGYEYHYFIKGNDSIMIMVKEKKQDYGVFTIPDIKYPCRGKFVEKKQALELAKKGAEEKINLEKIKEDSIYKRR